MSEQKPEAAHAEQQIADNLFRQGEKSGAEVVFTDSSKRFVMLDGSFDLLELASAIETDLCRAALEIDRLSLVIESAVRYADPSNSEVVFVALMRLRATLGVTVR